MGNPTDPDGPDGPDTNYLIRATTPEEAARVADVAIRTFPLCSPPVGRAVHDFCEYIAELGNDTSGETSATVVHGPWVAHAVIYEPGYSAWHRDAPNGAWVTLQKLYGTTS